jgi:hypothetical protein
MNQNNPIVRHSRAGGNPARINIPRSGQNLNVDPLMEQLAIRLSWQNTPAKSLVIRGRFFNQLDSRLRGNDAVLC